MKTGLQTTTNKKKAKVRVATIIYRNGGTEQNTHTTKSIIENDPFLASMLPIIDHKDSGGT